MNREDCLMLNQDIIYFDSGATCLKPYVLSKTTEEYYNIYCANAHRGDYDISLKVDEKYEGARELVQQFIGASKKEQIINNVKNEKLREHLFFLIFIHTFARHYR